MELVALILVIILLIGLFQLPKLFSSKPNSGDFIRGVFMIVGIPVLCYTLYYILIAISRK